MFNSDFYNKYKEGIIGFASSTVAYTIVNPIDVIKTNFQVKCTNANNNSKTQSLTKSICKDIYRVDGFRGFFRGLGSNLSTYPFFWGTFFQVKGYLDNNYDVKECMDKVGLGGKLQRNIVSTWTAASAGSFVANPLFMLKIRLQTCDKASRSTFGRFVRQIYREEGIRAFYKGFGATAFNNTKLCVQFPLREHLLTHRLLSNRSSEERGLISSFVAKLICNSVFYPLDIIRVNQRNSKEHVSMLEVSKRLIRGTTVGGNGGGIRGLYRGIFLYNMYTIPNFVILMYFKDILSKSI